MTPARDQAYWQEVYAEIKRRDLWDRIGQAQKHPWSAKVPADGLAARYKTTFGHEPPRTEQDFLTHTPDIIKNHHKEKRT